MLTPESSLLENWLPVTRNVCEMFAPAESLTKAYELNPNLGSPVLGSPRDRVVADRADLAERAAVEPDRSDSAIPARACQGPLRY